MGALWYPTLGAMAVYSDNPDIARGSVRVMVVLPGSGGFGFMGI